MPERPLPGKADVQILTLEISLPNDRYTPVSGHQADTMSRGRYRPIAAVQISVREYCGLTSALYPIAAVRVVGFQRPLATQSEHGTTHGRKCEWELVSDY